MNLKLTDKFVGYLAVTPNKKFMSLFERSNVQNILISYHYIRKNKAYTKEILEMIRDRGGLFMTDSGAFSFLNDKSFNPKTFAWEDYLDEYTEWLGEHSEFIFSACNLDVDSYVHHADILNWNEQSFKPLEEKMNIIYVAHPFIQNLGELGMVQQYSKMYKYIGVSEELKNQVAPIFQLAKMNKCSIHGLAWTKPTLLRDFPFFSVDSTSWVGYQKFGSTPVWDGRNFSQYDNGQKSIRTTLKKQAAKYGVKMYEFIHEVDEGTAKHNDDEGLTFSIRTWLDVFADLRKIANKRLNKTVEQLLIGKDMVWNGEQEEEYEEAEELPLENGGTKEKSSLDKLFEKDERIKGEVTPTTFIVDDQGNEVAVYEKREEEKIDITEFGSTFGNTMFCSSCFISEKCPKFRANSSCAFNFAPDAITQDPLSVIEFLIKAQAERVNRALFMEKLEGGMVNKVNSQEMKLLNDLNATRTNLMILASGKGLKLTKESIELTIKGGGGISSTDSEGNTEVQGGFTALLANLMNKK